ncbi:MAG: 30S ribosomal protein S6 [Termitinemataceae bacterium]|nr:MAG: 30S ribosomal protein S6 [Termitinemataceae bacterium]
MRDYELTVIYPLEEDQRKAGSEKLLQDLAGAGAELVTTNEMGDRDLAYEINKRKRAHYVLYNIKIDPAKIAQVDKIFKLNSNLVKYLFIRKQGSAA